MFDSSQTQTINGRIISVDNSNIIFEYDSKIITGKSTHNLSHICVDDTVKLIGKWVYSSENFSIHFDIKYIYTHSIREDYMHAEQYLDQVLLETPKPEQQADPENLSIITVLVKKNDEVCLNDFIEKTKKKLIKKIIVRFIEPSDDITMIIVDLPVCDAIICLFNRWTKIDHHLFHQNADNIRVLCDCDVPFYMINSGFESPLNILANHCYDSVDEVIDFVHVIQINYVQQLNIRLATVMDRARKIIEEKHNKLSDIHDQMKKNKYYQMSLDRRDYMYRQVVLTLKMLIMNKQKELTSQRQSIMELITYKLSKKIEKITLIDLDEDISTKDNNGISGYIGSDLLSD
jgi:hypothetical protein